MDCLVLTQVQISETQKLVSLLLQTKYNIYLQHHFNILPRQLAW